jgi:hypothetical protein
LCTTVALLINTTAHSQTKTDSTEYSLNVAAAKTINNSQPNASFGPWVNFRTRNIPQLNNYKTKAVATDAFGGRADKKGTKTGFYHTQKINDRWWIIDPEGHPFIHEAVCTVAPGQSDRNKEALKTKFGDNAGWAKGTIQSMTDNGFNGVGAWSAVDEIRQANLQAAKPLAYTVIINFMSNYGQKRGGTHPVPGHQGYAGNAIFVFDPDFITYCDERAKTLVTYKDDKNLLGYFSDNEMPLSRANLAGYLSLSHNEPGYTAAAKWSAEHQVDTAKLTEQNKIEFLGYVSDTYFSIVSAAIRKYDANHMYIGCRMHGAQRFYPEVVKAAGKYVDVLSINYYSYWTPELKDMQNWEKWSGKPFIASEWYVKGEDSGLANHSGAGWLVKTQDDRGAFYQNFILSLLESKSCVGWHWFKYQDNDPLQKGAELSNIDANKGIVGVNYDEYPALVKKMKELNTQVYSLIDYFDGRK